ncbi:hypothetical protein DdX_17451 [Ditylenchus destructor]|uniref:Uncharacterized protein n=1 Tax=Ditylenchus destructor TaxID=166010 RepID=A0AAD4MLD4_9BILA|nr:hypothetical protein DdX_17451 [Ditylenchus destructor]
MKFYLSAFLLFSTFLLTQEWFPSHIITPEKEELNLRIKLEYTEIKRVVSIGGHENLEETLDGVLKVLDGDVSKLLVFKDLDAVSAAAGSEPYFVRNELAPLLKKLHPNIGTVDQLPKRELKQLYDFAGDLAQTYVRFFKDDFGEEKEVQVVPIAKLKDEGISLEDGPLPPTSNKAFQILFGVLGRRTSGNVSGKLKGFAGLVVRFENL